MVSEIIRAKPHQSTHALELQLESRARVMTCTASPCAAHTPAVAGFDELHVLKVPSISPAKITGISGKKYDFEGFTPTS